TTLHPIPPVLLPLLPYLRQAASYHHTANAGLREDYSIPSLPVFLVSSSVEVKHSFGIVFLFRSQIAYRYVFVGVIAYKAVVFLYFFVHTINNIHTLFVIQ